MKTVRFFLHFILFISPLIVFSQDGSFDPTFGGSGFVLTGIDDNSDYPSDILQQADGKLVMSGLSFGSGNSNSVILRYQTNGDLDPSFGNNGIVITDNSANTSEVNLQNNDKILLSIRHYDSYIVQRYSSSGQLDTDFADNGSLIPNELPSKIKVLDDESLLLVGATTNGVDYSIVLQKYLLNGNIDTLFGTNGISTIDIPFANAELIDFKVHSDGSIIVLSTRGFTGSSEVILTKLLLDGSIDNSFGVDGSSFYTIDVGSNQDHTEAAFDIAQNGNIIIAVTAGGCQTVFKRILIRFLLSGLLDQTFGNEGTITLSDIANVPFKVIIQENNRILVGENVYDCFEWADLSISRYYENGMVDSSFSLSNSGYQPDGGDFILQADGEIVAIGATPWFVGDENFYIGRYQNNPLGIPEFNSEKFVVFPNPSERIFNIRNKANLDSEIRYQILDVTARIIETGVLTENSTQIDLSKAKTGIYFLKVAGGSLQLIKN